MSLQGWRDMACDCGNSFFYPVFKLKWHEQHGTSDSPSGWSCTGCGKRNDNATMIRKMKILDNQNKIRELQEQG